MNRFRFLFPFLFSFLLAISCGEGVPTGERLVHGDCTFERGSSSLTINQNSAKAIINWESFSLAEGELVRFLQPSSGSALLNRVISRSPSEIYGQLQANGKIYLINQNGIVIGPTGKIQAASFIASTLHLEDALFLQDELRFSGNRGGKLLQQGMIAVEGSIFLLACEVVNEGLLSAPNGSVCLASGSEVYLIDSRDGGTVKISGVGSVANRGGIEAARAELRASAGNIYALAVNQEGIIDATGSVEVDGEIILQAESGLVLVSGEMSAEQEGKIHLLGDFVHLIGTAALSVSGDAGGGEILVGGDYKGSNPAIPNAKGIYVGPNVRLSADALDRGDGGKIIFWGTDANYYYGVTSAQGGPLGGDGGFIEISSHGLLVPQGCATTFAPQGRTGTLLFDPVTFTVSTNATSGINPAPPPPHVTDPYTAAFTGNTANILNTDLQMALSVNNVVINTTGSGAGTGDIDIQASVTWSTANTLTMIGRSVTIDSGVTVSNSFASGAFTAVDFRGNVPNVFTGSFTGITLSGTISTVNGHISLQGNGGTTGGNYGVQVTSNGTAASATGSGNITVTGNSTQFPGISISSSGMNPSLFSTQNGTISLTTTQAAGNNAAIVVQSATLQCLGMGGIAITGSGQLGPSIGFGVSISNATLATGSGNINVTGTGSSVGSTTQCYGLSLSNDTISSTSGTITLSGQGGGGSQSNFGLSSTGVDITSTSGPININGTGGSSGSQCTGLTLSNGTIASMGGTLTIIGQGGGGTQDNSGFISSSVGISCASGQINITGVAGSSGNASYGIQTTGGSIASSGNVPITLMGQGFGTFSGIGMGSIPSATAITNTSGTISLVGTGTTGLGNALFLQAIGGATSGAITLTANTMMLNGAITTTSSLLVQPVTPSAAIFLGNTGSGLWLSNTSLSYLQSTLGTTIGRANGTHAITATMATFVSNTTLQGTGITIGTSGVSTTNNNMILFNIGVNQPGNFSKNGPFNSGVFFAQGSTSDDVFTVTNMRDSMASFGLDGGSGNNSLLGPDSTSLWTITGNNAGTLGSYPFSNIGYIQGGNKDDTFTFTGAFQLINLFGLSGIDGGSAGVNQIVGPDVATSWDINGLNTGGLTPASSPGPTFFADITDLLGGSMDDTFMLIEGGSITGIVDGGGGINTLDYTAYTDPITVNLSGTATDTGGFANIQNFLGGSGDNTLQGQNVMNTWVITGTNAGSINLGAFTFSSFENLVGGFLDDTFDFTAGFVVTGMVDGAGGGGNTLLGPNMMNTWNITGTNSGSVASISFMNIQNLVGGSMNDLFVFGAGAGVSGTVDGGGGTNTLNYAAYTTAVLINLGTATATGTGGFANIQSAIGSNSNDTIEGPDTTNIWSLTANNTGAINGSVFTFFSFENLIGGTANDTFDFTGGFLINGSIDGNTGSNSLLAPNAAVNTWNITGSNAGSLVNIIGTTNFISVQNLTGGSLIDNFVFANGAGVTGAVDGRMGVNTFNYSAYTTPVAVNIGAGTATGVGTFANIQNFIGGSGSDTLQGPNTANTWNFTLANQGSINGGAFTFTSFENLTGGNSSDTFFMNNAFTPNVSGTLNGGGGVNTLDYSVFTLPVTINLAAGIATSTGGIANIQHFLGGIGVNTFGGPSGTNAWTITGTNSGSINGVFFFSSFANLSGSLGNDTFDFTPGFLVTGRVDGGGGSNTLLAPNANNIWNVTSHNAGNLPGITFSNIGSLTGGNLNDRFIFANQQGLSGLVNGGGPASGNILDYTAFSVPPQIIFTSPTSGRASNLGTGFTDIGSILGLFTEGISTESIHSIQVYFTQLSLSYLLATPLWYDLFNQLQLEMNTVLGDTNKLWRQINARVIYKRVNGEDKIEVFSIAPLR